MIDWQPIWLTLQLATLTTALLFLVGVPLSRWLASSKSWTVPIVETLVSMPLVLPPTVIGFYLLMAFSPNRGLGKWLSDQIGLEFVFSFEGLVLASLIYSLPFMIHPLQSGFRKVPGNLRESALLMGKSKTQVLFKVLLPNIKPQILTALVLSFAHTVGEFGVVLMIGGNIPGLTQVASIAVYDRVEAMDYGQAHMFSLVLFLISFSILLVVNIVNRGTDKKYW